MIVDYLGYAMMRRGYKAIAVIKGGMIVATAPSYDAAIRWIETWEGRSGLATLRPNVSVIIQPEEDPPHAA